MNTLAIRTMARRYVPRFHVLEFGFFILMVWAVTMGG
jgi:hypothetical protein